MPPFFLPDYAGFDFYSPSARDRINRFRATHRTGERVVGVFLRWHGPGLGWVEFQGGPLLASMASQPEPGTRLRFLVKQLYPDIILQEILARDRPGVLNLLQQFWVRQNRLETSLSQLTLCTPEHFSVQKALLVFKQIVNTHPQLRQEFIELLALEQALNTELEHRNLGRFFGLPWLAGYIREAGLLIPMQPTEGSRGTACRAPALNEAQFVCSHPLTGHLEVHFLLARNPAEITLFLERIELEPLLSTCLQKWFKRITPQPLVFSGIKPLSGEWRSGILARLLLPWESKTSVLHFQI
jgi:hypothetical protein